jgi:hypothetical protein
MHPTSTSPSNLAAHPELAAIQLFREVRTAIGTAFPDASTNSYSPLTVRVLEARRGGLITLARILQRDAPEAVCVLELGSFAPKAILVLDDRVATSISRNLRNG